MQKRQGWFFTSALLITFLCAFPTLAAKDFRKFRDINSELIYAVSNGTAAEVTALLKEKAKPDARNISGVPALSLAASRTEKGPEIMEALLKGGANLEVEDRAGQTPLFYAAKRGLIDNVQFILEQGAKYYHTDNLGHIARTYAYTEGHKDVFDAMDKFVEDQSAAVYAAYEERNRRLLAQFEKANERLDKAQRKEVEAIEKKMELEAEKKRLSQTLKEKEKQLEEYARQKAEAEEAKRLEEKAQKPDTSDLALKQNVHQLSYHACAYQYWHLIQFREAPTTYEEQPLRDKVAEHESKMNEITKSLKKHFNINDKYIDSIVKPSRDYVRKIFAKRPTNAHLTAEDIGTEDDAHKRCNKIANRWEMNK